MRNRRKTLLRDHLVPEVTLKACPRHYSVSAVLRPSPFEDLKDLPDVRTKSICVHHLIIFNVVDLKKKNPNKFTLFCITIFCSKIMSIYILQFIIQPRI